MKKARATAKKAAPGAQEISAGLLDDLRGAGTAGLKSARLRLSGKSPSAAFRRDALSALLLHGQVKILGSSKVGDSKAWYFLAEFAPTATTVAARLQAAACVPVERDSPVRLWSQPELLRQLPAHERALLDFALSHLYAERQAVPLCHLRKTFVAFAQPLGVWLDGAVSAAIAASSPAEVAITLDDVELLAAYTRLVRESNGFPDVKIARLQHAVGGLALSERLLALWRGGRATLSLGDWSLADEATRAAAVELDGEKYLLVRLNE